LMLLVSSRFRETHNCIPGYMLRKDFLISVSAGRRTFSAPRRIASDEHQVALRCWS